jgi:hypothetical protein
VYEVSDGNGGTDTAIVTITIEPTNQAPIVDAGLNQTITLPDGAISDATVTDDGRPDPPGTMTTLWSVDSGPGTVTFGDASAVDTTASFTTEGVYVLRLTANDSELTAFDVVTVTVTLPTFNFLPIDDASVYSNDPSANFGPEQTLLLRGHKNQTIHAYIKFEVNGLDGIVTSVKLRFFSNKDSNSTVPVYLVSNNYQTSGLPWEEDSLTWETAPEMSGTPIFTLDTSGGGTWVEFDLTGAIEADGVYSFGLLTSARNWVIYNSKEADENHPTLVVTFQPTP